MSADSETPPQPNQRPQPVVARRQPSAAAPRTVNETSPAPLGFEALLREINTVVELLERIDGALDAQTAQADDDAGSLTAESDLP